jgi:hypothetical protein
MTGGSTLSVTVALIAAVAASFAAYQADAVLAPLTLGAYGLTRDIFGANWRCGRNISWHNGSAVMA